MCIRIKPTWLSVKYVKRNGQCTQYENSPQVVVERNKKSGAILKVVDVAGNSETQTLDEEKGFFSCNGFEHPRTIISDFDVAKATLLFFAGKCLEGKRPLRTPRLVMHPLEELEGGLTQIEKKALLALGFSLGANEVYLYTEADELSDEELFTLDQNSRVIRGELTDCFMVFYNSSNLFCSRVR